MGGSHDGSVLLGGEHLQPTGVRSGEGHELRVFDLELLDAEGRISIRRWLGVLQVVDHRVDRIDHQGQEDERQPHREPQDPAPQGEAGPHQRRVPGLHHLGVAGHPRGVGEGDARGQGHLDEDQGVQRSVGVVGLMEEDHQHHDRPQGTDQHQRLPHLELVGQDAEDDQCHGVGPPEPGVQSVGLRGGQVDAVRVLEHGGPVDREEGGGGVVQQQEEGDPDGRSDEVHLQDLTPRVGSSGQHFLFGYPSGPGLDQRPVLLADHQLVPEPGGEILEEEEGEHEHDERGHTRDHELALPSSRVASHEVVQGAGGHHGGDEAAGHGTDGPEPHGRGPAQLRAEVTHQGGSSHQDGALHQAQQADHSGELPLGLTGRDTEGHQDADDQQSVDHDVGAPELVGLGGRQRGEGADQVGDDHDPHVERERHVIRHQDLRRHPGLGEVRVVQDDGGQYGQGQVRGALAVARILVYLMDEQELREPARLLRLSCQRRCTVRHVEPPGSALRTRLVHLSTVPRVNELLQAQHGF